MLAFNEFRGLGSGRVPSLGAMHAVWGETTAREVALTGLDGDKASQGSVVLSLEVAAGAADTDAVAAAAFSEKKWQYPSRNGHLLL